ncbi:MAG TPA: hypothetical protein DD422_04210 [Akkermansia sp.]|nr:hypothetical protein [Akkermansia sp.]
MPGKSLDAFPEEKFPALKKLIFLNKKTPPAAILINGTCRKSHCLSNPNFHAAAGSLSSLHRQRHGGRPLSRGTCGMNRTARVFLRVVKD